MKFSGNFDELTQNSDNFKLEIKRNLLSKYGHVNGLQESQITSVHLSRGSVIVTVIMEDDCGLTTSANVTWLLIQMEQDVRIYTSTYTLSIYIYSLKP